MKQLIGMNFTMNIVKHPPYMEMERNPSLYICVILLRIIDFYLNSNLNFVKFKSEFCQIQTYGRIYIQSNPSVFFYVYSKSFAYI